MNKLRAYAITGLASAAAIGGGSAGYEHFSNKTAPGVQHCLDKYVEKPEVLDRCTERVPFTSGRIGMGILGAIGVAGFGGSIGLSLRAIYKS